MMNLNKEICNAFNTHSEEYEKYAKVQIEIGQRLFGRLDYLKINPKYVLDLGCGTGVFSVLLKKRYPKAIIVGLDLAYSMLVASKNKYSWLNKWPLVNANILNLPFEEGSFDLIFANQVIHWSKPLQNALSELSRVMSKDACLMLTTLGPDTFKELKNAWTKIDNYQHANDFTDMHNIGDALLASNFVDPVVDMENLTINYKSSLDLVKSLKAQGVRNINKERKQGLTSKAQWDKFHQAYITNYDNKYPLSYEIVYGHAWKGEIKPDNSETIVSLNDLRQTLHK